MVAGDKRKRSPDVTPNISGPFVGNATLRAAWSVLLSSQHEGYTSDRGIQGKIVGARNPTETFTDVFQCTLAREAYLPQGARTSLRA